jgi:hypothetical protein
VGLVHVANLLRFDFVARLPPFCIQLLVSVALVAGIACGAWGGVVAMGRWYRGVGNNGTPTQSNGISQ